MFRIEEHIRSIPDFPKPGILFRDITPLLADADGFRQTILALAEPHRSNPPDYVAGIESRGFIFASALALELGAGLVVLRKPGKLPYKTRKVTYALEYGTDSIEVHEDAVAPGQSVLLVDDLLATGGTMEAASKLISELGGVVVEHLFVIELAFLEGRRRLENAPVRALLSY